MLVENMKEHVEVFEHVRQDDGEGGFSELWQKVADINAVVSASAAGNAYAAGSQVATGDSVVTCDLGTGLHLGQRIRTDAGRTLEVVSDAKDRHTPSVASFAFERVIAKEVAHDA